MHCGNVHVVALETKMIHVPKSIKCMCVGRKQSKVKTSLKRNERDQKNYYVPATHLIVRGGGGGGASKLNTVSKGYREGKNMKGQLQKTKTMRALMKTPCKHSLQVDIKVMSL